MTWNDDTTTGVWCTAGVASQIITGLTDPSSPPGARNSAGSVHVEEQLFDGSAGVTLAVGAEPLSVTPRGTGHRREVVLAVWAAAKPGGPA
ncbi:hypothetical protein ACFVYT_40090 [Streptomyces sp. NPDC058290]|uniref:hypothetical protein n=1 Tax=Streptomyces sp. NPDC058290 TaxID=3346426 RepID=UPI0036E6D310